MKVVIEEEVAAQEIKEFVDSVNFKSTDIDKIKELYPEVILSLQLGLLVIENGIPTVTLKDPIRSESEEIQIDKITLKTRILASEQRKILNGVKEPVLAAHKSFAFIIGQPLSMLDKFSPFDYKVLEQLSTVFI